MLKSCGWGGGVGWWAGGPCDFGAAQGPNPFFLFLRTFIQLGGLLGQGLGLGPELDNFNVSHTPQC